LLQTNSGVTVVENLLCLGKRLYLRLQRDVLVFFQFCAICGR